MQVRINDIIIIIINTPTTLYQILLLSFTVYPYYALPNIHTAHYLIPVYPLNNASSTRYQLLHCHLPCLPNTLTKRYLIHYCPLANQLVSTFWQVIVLAHIAKLEVLREIG